MSKNELGRGNLHIPGWTAEASLAQEKNKLGEIKGGHGYISQVIPQFEREDMPCEAECRFCEKCIERHGFEFCSATDLCWGCSRCRARQFSVYAPR
jgi:hypothetical protein